VAGPHTPVPIGKAIRSTYLWTIEIGKRHPEGLVATILAFLVVSAIPAIGPALAGFSLIPLMMVSHNEVIRGPAGFNTVSLGPGWRRVLRFFLDEVMLGFMLMAIYILPVLLLVALVVALKPKENPGGALVVVLLGLPLLMAVVVFITVAAMRLTLRFPSRSIDAALKWGEAWAIGKGHTFRLIVASSIIGTPVDRAVGHRHAGDAGKPVRPVAVLWAGAAAAGDAALGIPGAGVHALHVGFRPAPPGARAGGVVYPYLARLSGFRAGVGAAGLDVGAVAVVLADIDDRVGVVDLLRECRRGGGRGDCGDEGGDDRGGETPGELRAVSCYGVAWAFQGRFSRIFRPERPYCPFVQRMCRTFQESYQRTLKWPRRPCANPAGCPGPRVWGIFALQ